MIEQKIRSQVIHYCQRMDAKCWVANHDGNLSVKVQDDRFAITPSARSKADLREEDLLEINSEGKILGGTGKVFSEWAIHSRVFSGRSDVSAVVHAHPPSATAVGVSNQEMATTAIPEAVVSLGPGIPLVSLVLPNSEALWLELDALLPHYDAVMIAGNGVFSWGKSLEQAFLRMELVEHLATIFLRSLPLGVPRMLADEQVSTLLKAREKAGLMLPPDPARPQWFPS